MGIKFVLDEKNKPEKLRFFRLVMKFLILGLQVSKKVCPSLIYTYFRQQNSLVVEKNRFIAKKFCNRGKNFLVINKI